MNRRDFARNLAGAALGAGALTHTSRLAAGAPPPADEGAAPGAAPKLHRRIEEGGGACGREECEAAARKHRSRREPAVLPDIGGRRVQDYRGCEPSASEISL